MSTNTTTATTTTSTTTAPERGATMSTESSTDSTPQSDPASAGSLEARGSASASAEARSAPSPAPIRKMTTEGALPCGYCGTEVLEPSESGVFQVTPLARVTYRSDGSEKILPFGYASPVMREGQPLVTVEMGTCPACAERHEQARKIVEKHPSIAARLGPDSAVHQVSAALDGLAAIGQTPSAGLLADLEEDASMTWHMLSTLRDAGVGARWLSRFAPYADQDAATGRCAVSPWAHVGSEVRSSLRDGYGQMLAYRLARDEQDQCVTPPGRSAACLMCGIGAVSIPATRVVALGGLREARERLWSERTVTTHTLGGPSGGSRRSVAGHLCHECETAVEYVGSIGQAAMSRSYAQHLRAAGRTLEAQLLSVADDLGRIPGLIGHGVRGGKPNAERWSHLRLDPDLLAGDL